MIKEFKDFLFRGNIVELAVAFVMGLAFAAVVNSLVNNLVMPIIAAIIGKPDFRDLTFTIHQSVFHYGAFLTDRDSVRRHRSCRLLLHRQARADDARAKSQGADRGGHARRGASPPGTPGRAPRQQLNRRSALCACCRRRCALIPWRLGVLVGSGVRASSRRDSPA